MVNILAVLAGKMFIFDGLSGTSRTIKLRQRQVDCLVCGANPSIASLVDYQAFCGCGATDKVPSLSLLSSSDRVSCQEYHSVVTSRTKHLLIDVRSTVEFAICHLDNAISILWAEFYCTAHL